MRGVHDESISLFLSRSMISPFNRNVQSLISFHEAITKPLIRPVATHRARVFDILGTSAGKFMNNVHACVHVAGRPHMKRKMTSEKRRHNKSHTIAAIATFCLEAHLILLACFFRHQRHSRFSFQAWWHLRPNVCIKFVLFSTCLSAYTNASDLSRVR